MTILILQSGRVHCRFGKHIGGHPPAEPEGSVGRAELALTSQRLATSKLSCEFLSEGHEPRHPTLQESVIVVVKLLRFTESGRECVVNVMLRFS